MTKIQKVSGTSILQGNIVDSLEDNSSANAPSQRAINEALKNFGLKVLWENPDRTQAFGAQTIELNSNDYDFMIWIYMCNTGMRASNFSGGPKTAGINLSISYYYNDAIRQASRTAFLVDDTHYRIDVGHGANNEVDNNLCIPWMVLGVKLGGQ